MDIDHNTENCHPMEENNNCPPGNNCPPPEGNTNCPPLAGVACHASGVGGGEAQAITPEQWEKNHVNITRCISEHIYAHSRLPNHQEMAARTGMTGEEVGRHLEQFTYHSAYGEEIELLRMMSTEVLARVGFLAAHGDLNAAKLYAEVLHKEYQKPPAPPAQPVQEGPSGYFIINGVHAHYNVEPFLEPEERAEIEAILRAPANRPPEERIEAQASPEVRNCRWKEHHRKIISIIDHYMRNFSRMPTASELVKETGLSRQTIHKHIHEFTHHPAFRREIEQFRALTNRIIVMVLDKARCDDVKAARLFFKIMKDIYPAVKPQEWSQNYLLFNSARMDKETIDQLSPEQQATIATHFKKAIDRFSAAQRKAA